ncbi:hypothetical protein PCC6912_55710 [Chlorogloeopsis fritschii PCC 6912]|uniref:Uncharacterized protein n=1 Tax=Chlorogloeopsis fritschii PCC 6912 TaxID=211165 RepID=A0A433MZ08_CHLFR|nr:hypothetical protein PCC6912_55710 [Chlorogloeopsis fritschii PCC 6912]
MVKDKEAALAGARIEDAIRTVVAAKKDGTTDIEKKFFMLIQHLQNRIVRLN